jgi:hypothetical protein
VTEAAHKLKAILKMIKTVERHNPTEQLIILWFVHLVELQREEKRCGKLFQQSVTECKVLLLTLLFKVLTMY